jgi:hypothetical protein
MYQRYVKQLGRRFLYLFSGQKRPSVAQHSVGAGENISAGADWELYSKEEGNRVLESLLDVDEMKKKYSEMKKAESIPYSQRFGRHNQPSI